MKAGDKAATVEREGVPIEEASTEGWSVPIKDAIIGGVSVPIKAAPIGGQSVPISLGKELVDGAITDEEAAMWDQVCISLQGAPP